MAYLSIYRAQSYFSCIFHCFSRLKHCYKTTDQSQDINSYYSNFISPSGKFVTFAKRGFEAANSFRAMHHSPPLKWSDKLAARAQKLAYQMALNGSIQAPGVDQLGENRAKLSAVNYDCEMAGEEASRIWYSQGSHYSYSDPRLNSDTDSFTQLIWKNTREIGMGCAQRKGSVTNEIYVVALYYPSGNSELSLRENVLDPKKIGRKDVYATIYRRGHMGKVVYN